jgi:hypothetical protein
MNKTVFENIFENIIVPEIEKRREYIEINSTALLIVDGHVSRLSGKVFSQAVQHRIDIVCIPSHISHIIQPNDRGVNSAVKASFKKFSILENEISDETKKETFIKILQTALSKGLTSDTIRHAWMDSGIYPFNPLHILSKCEILTPHWALIKKKRNNTLNISGEILVHSSRNYSFNNLHNLYLENSTNSINSINIDISTNDFFLKNVNIFNLPEEFSSKNIVFFDILNKIKTLSSSWNNIEIKQRIDFSVIIIELMRIINDIINSTNQNDSKEINEQIEEVIQQIKQNIED